MSDSFGFKKGFRLPSRVFTLNGNGVASLAELDVGSIKFVYRNVNLPLERHEIVATIVDAPTRKVRVDFGAIDTGTIAQYFWHFEAKQGGLAMAFPETGFYTFSVVETIGTP